MEKPGGAGVSGVAAPPVGRQSAGQALAAGDWICPGCKSSVFATKDACYNCHMPRGSSQVNRGSVYDPDRKMRGAKGRRFGEEEVAFGDFGAARRRDRSPDRRGYRDRDGYERGGDYDRFGDRDGCGDRGGYGEGRHAYHDRRGGGDRGGYDRGGYDRSGERGRADGERSRADGERGRGDVDADGARDRGRFIPE